MSIRIFIGFDEVETVAYHTLCHSIARLCQEPVTITPLITKQLSVYKRLRDPKQSNEFSFTRFLVPWLCNYEGWALFMDCDMLLRADISELWGLRDWTKDVQVVKHDYIPKDEYKYLGAKQYAYPCKNWSSVMLFNNERSKTLTPDYINNANAMDLHRFKWANEIGDLPKEWNHLVGEYDYNPDAKIVHFTVGGPYFEEYAACDYADEWFRANKGMNFCKQYTQTKVSSR